MKTNRKPTTKSRAAKAGAVKARMPKKEATKQTVGSLSESQSKYRDLVERLPQVIYTSEIGINGKWEYVSPQIKNLLGFTQQEWLADPANWERHVHPDDLPGQLALEEQAYAKGEPFEGEYRMFTRNGSEIWVRDAGHIRSRKRGTRAANETPIVEGLLMDITDHKKSKIEIEQLKKFSESIIQSANDGIIVMNADGVFQLVNRAGMEIYGRRADEIVGHHWKEIIPEDQHGIIDVADQYRLRNESSRYEMELARPNGERRTVLVSGSPRFERDQLVGSMAVFTDITAHKQAEKDLKERDEQYRTLFENTPIGIGVADLQGNLLAYNHAMLEAGGYSPKDMEKIGNVAALYFESKERDEALELFRQQGFLKNFPVRFKRKDGTPYDALLTLTFSTFNGQPCVQAMVEDITERKQVEESMRASEERHRTLVNGMLDGVYRSTHAGKFVDVNPAMLKLFGYESREEMLALDIKKDMYFAPGERESLFLDTGQEKVDEFRMKRKDGSEIWVEDHGQYVHDSQGNVIYHMGILRDITARKQAEENLIKAEVKYRTLVEQIPPIVYTAERDQHIGVTYISPRIKLLGFTQDEWLADPELWFRQIHPDDQARVLEEIERIRHSGKPFKGEYRLRTRDGYTRWILDEVMDISDGAGNILFRQGSMLDITERKQAEEELRISEEKYRDLYENNPIMLFTLGTDGTILAINQTTVEQLEYENDELIGESVLKVFHPEEHQKVLKIFHEFIEHPLQAAPWEFRKLTKSGKNLWVSETSRLVSDKQGNQTVLISCEDVTARKQAEQDIRQSEHKYRTLADQVPAVIYTDLATDSGETTYISPYVEKMLGYTAQDWVADPNLCNAITHPDDRAQLARENKNAQRTESFSHDYRYIARDGHIVWVRDEAMLMKDEAGIPKLWQGVMLDITAQKQAEEALQKREKILSALQETTLVLMERLELTEVLQTITNEITQLMNTPNCFLYLVEPDGKNIKLRMGLGLNSRHVGILLKPGEGVAGKVWESKQRLVIQDYHTWEYRSSQFEQYNIHGIAGVPLTAGAQVVGALGVAYLGEDYVISPEDVELLIRFAQLASIALKNARLYEDAQNELTERKRAEEKIQWQNRRLKVLREIDTAILGADTVENIVSAALDHMRELVDCSRTAVALFDWETNEALLFDVRTVGKTSMPEGTRIPLALFQEMMQTLLKKKEVLIDDFNAVADPQPQIQSAIKEGLRSLCLLPLFSQGNLIGSFSLFSEIPGFFDEERINLGREVANQVAIAITQNNLLEAMRKLNTELEERVIERTAQLQAANKELEAFSYSVSHDLRAPLRGIDGFSQALTRKYAGQLGEDGEHYLMRIHENTRNMGQLIDDLLSLARITRREIKQDDVNLSKVAREIADGLRAQESGRQVEFEIAEQAQVRGDAGLLKIILQNLMGNAMKFTSTRGQAKIQFGILPSAPTPLTAEEAGGGEGKIFFVRDNGVGFDMSYADKLFGAFQRLHAADQFPGSGIGLATVQRIVHRHNGRVWAEAEVDKGAAFYFTLGAIQ